MTRLAVAALLLVGTVLPAAAQLPVARLERVAGGMAHPVAMSAFPDAHGRLAVVDQTGQVWIVDDSRRLPTPFLDVQPQMVELEDSYDERGLLGMAFHPDYAQNGRFFVWYSVPLRDAAPDDWNHTNRLSEFRVSEGDPMRADASSERVVLEIDHPYMNHNAGQLTFGPDGMLYVGVGDGGNRDDEGRGHVDDWYERNAGGNGQDVTQNLMGSILRLDVDRQDPGKAYAVPRDNPFAPGGAMAGQGLPEIWAYGLRNPWRMSWDRAGEMGLIAGDVGQELYDEVSVITAGGNYGWNVYEAAHCFGANQPKRPPRDCPDADPMGNSMQMPIIEAGNASAFRDAHGLALVGGYVYRGRALPALRGRYVFGNWSRGRTPGHSHSGGGHSGSGSEDDGHMGGYVTLAVPRQGGLWGYIGLPLEGALSGEIEPFVLGFGEDASGELYVLTTEARGPHGDSGTVWRLAPVD